MKNLILSLVVFATCGLLSQVQAQTNSNDQKIESFDEMINEIEKSMKEMLQTLDSEEFQKELERAQIQAKEQLNITQDADGNYLFNGEIVDIDGLTGPGNDILELFKNDFHISGDLEEMLEESGAMFEGIMEEFEKIMEENFQEFEDFDINFDFDGESCDKKKKKGKTKTTITL